MANHTPVQADPKEIERAQEMWANFTKVSKWGIIAVVVILVGLAAVFINW